MRMLFVLPIEHRQLPVKSAHYFFYYIISVINESYHVADDVLDNDYSLSVSVKASSGITYVLGGVAGKVGYLFHQDKEVCLKIIF